MIRLLKYRLKIILNDKGTMFWTFIFPLLLATLFGLSFGSFMNSRHGSELIKAAVVDRGMGSEFKIFLNEISKPEDAVISVLYAGEEEAAAMLNDKKVSGIIYAGEEITLRCRENGLSQSILKGVIDRYLQIEATIYKLAEINPAGIPAAISRLTADSGYTKEISLSNGSMDNMRNYFYALISMVCLYSSFLGLKSALNIQPNMSHIGVRQGISPIKKSTLVLSEIAGAQTVSYANVVITILYIRYILGISLGSNIWSILLLCFLGALTGVMTGMFVGIVLPIKDGKKEGVLIALSMVLSFFAGLMYNGMMNVVEKYAPLFNRLNPAALLVDSFYALDTYGVGPRYWNNMLLLFCISLVISLLCLVFLRRKQYARI